MAKIPRVDGAFPLLQPDSSKSCSGFCGSRKDYADININYTSSSLRVRFLNSSAFLYIVAPKGSSLEAMVGFFDA